MKKLTAKQLAVIGLIFTSIFGSVNHFLYEWTGVAIVALVGPVNESVWEHLKILVTPILVFLIVEWIASKDKQRLLAAKFAQIVFGIVFMIAFFYTYSGVIGQVILWVDIMLFYLTAALSYIVSYRVVTRKAAPKLPSVAYVAGIALIVLCLWVTTFFPPEMPLFYDSSAGRYGIGD